MDSNNRSEPPSSASDNLEVARQSLLEIYNQMSKKSPLKWNRASSTQKIIIDELANTLSILENLQTQIRALAHYSKDKI